MINTLDPEQIALLKKRHKTEKSGDVRDRIKTVVLRNSGWTEEKIAEALLIHIETVKRHLKQLIASFNFWRIRSLIPCI